MADLVAAALALTAIERIRELHKPVPDGWHPEVLVCAECQSLCHSETGLMCEQPVDAQWPCDTAKLLPKEAS